MTADGGHGPSTALDAFRDYIEAVSGDRFCDVVKLYLAAETVESARLVILARECRRRSTVAHYQDQDDLRDAFLRLEHAILTAAAAFDKTDWFEENE